MATKKPAPKLNAAQASSKYGGGIAPSYGGNVPSMSDIGMGTTLQGPASLNLPGQLNIGSKSAPYMINSQKFLSTIQNDPVKRRQFLIQLYNAHYYDSSTYSSGRLPNFDVLDTNAMMAIQGAVNDSLQSNASLQDVINMGSSKNQNAANGVGGGNVYTIRLDDPASIRQAAEDIGTKLLGRKLSAGEKQKYANNLIGLEKSNQMKTYGTQEAASINQFNIQSGQTGIDGKPVDGLDAFMQAIGKQESGGNYNASNPSGAQGKYQILASNWPGWAKEAGLPANAPKTPANQEKVARFKFQQYYSQYGDWRKVASAWYSGNPNLSNSTKPQKGGPSVKGYVDSVISKMGGSPQAAPSNVFAGGATPQSSASYIPATYATDQAVDTGAQLQEQIRGDHPVEAGAHDFANIYDLFTRLIHGGSAS